jgi:hypothetical protein
MVDLRVGQRSVLVVVDTEVDGCAVARRRALPRDGISAIQVSLLDRFAEATSNKQNHGQVFHQHLSSIDTPQGGPLDDPSCNRI